MDKAWWEKVVVNCPKALEDCKSYFQHRYKANWRSDIKSCENLSKYFSENKISIYIHWKNNGGGFKRYGFKISNYMMKIQSGYLYNSSNKASENALEWAFKILESKLDTKSKKSIIKPGRKIKRTMNKPDWSKQKR